MKLAVNIPNPLLRQYLLSTLSVNAEGYIISGRSATGGLMCSLARWSSAPPKVSVLPSTVNFSLPLNNTTMPLRGKFVYVTPSDCGKINTMLQREFTLEFLSFVCAGRMAGVKHKDIIESFIAQHQLYDVPTAFETLTKKRYRAAKRADQKFSYKFRKRPRRLYFKVKN